MTEFYLVRHGATDAIGQSFTGRLPGVRLNAEGRAQAAMLVRHFHRTATDAIYSSPSDRARETAGLIASALDLEVQCDSAFNEIDVGEWSGQSFQSLNQDPGFTLFNSLRSLARPPSGEMMLEVQSRAVGELIRISQRHADQAVAVVSHSDVIKSVLAFFLGIPLDLAGRLQIDLCSISIVRLSPDQVQVIAVNRIC